MVEWVIELGEFEGLIKESMPILLTPKELRL